MYNFKMKRKFFISLFIVFFFNAFLSVTPYFAETNELALAVEWNDPFDPAAGEYTEFHFSVRNVDRQVRIRVFTLTGMLVKQWPELAALKDNAYIQRWDGKNEDGDIAARGIYLVNLEDVVSRESITRKVIVLKK
jgi:hypothetical protein